MPYKRSSTSASLERSYCIIYSNESLSEFQLSSRLSHFYSLFFQSSSRVNPCFTYSLRFEICSWSDFIIASFLSDYVSFPSLTSFSSAFLSRWTLEAIRDLSLFNSSSSPFFNGLECDFLFSSLIRELIIWSGLVLRALGIIGDFSESYEFLCDWSESDYWRFSFSPKGGRIYSVLELLGVFD